MSDTKLTLDTYELLAKLMSSEDIDVVFNRKMSAPASFDLKKRILNIAPLKEHQHHLLPGLVAHEIGHTLFTNPTPEELEKIKRITKLFNIIEDGYQERQVCKKFPGSKKYLYDVFNEFFIKNHNPQHYDSENKIVSIVNTLNYNCKGLKHGKCLKYPEYVEKDDLILLHKAENLSKASFMARNDDSVELAKALKKYGEIKEDKPDKSEGQGDISPDDLGEDEDSESEVTESDEANTKDPSDGSTDDDKEPEEFIEDELSEHDDLLNDHHKKFDHDYSDEPAFSLIDFQSLRKISTIIDLHECTEDIFAAVEKSPSHFRYVKKYMIDHKHTKRIAQQMFQKYTVQLQTSNYAKTQFKKSGSLDPTKLVSYKVADDIFINNEITPNNSNHAYVVMLDWSGSMSDNIVHLVHRVMELAFFAKLADVELEVWLYTTPSEYVLYNHTEESSKVFNASKFIKVLNTKSNSDVQLNKNLKSLWTISSLIGERQNIYTEVEKELAPLAMVGTTILEANIFGHGILSMMEAQNKTLFILTDGEDHLIFNNILDQFNNRIEKLGPNPKDILFNGRTIDAIIKAPPGMPIREKCCRAITDFYAMIGHKTVGISWNMGDKGKSNMFRFANHNVNINSGNVTDNNYVEMQNDFIREIVKNLI